MNDNWIKIRGKKSEIIKNLQEVGFSQQVSEKLLLFLAKEKNILAEDEFCIMEESCEISSGKMLGLMLMDCTYYINIRVGTAFLLSLLIDNNIGMPIASTYLTARGVNRLIEKIDEHSGAKCILLEILRHPDKAVKEDVLSNFHGECCNNYLKCRFKKEYSCRCTNKEVLDILEHLVSAGIIRKEDEVYYYSPLGVL